MARLKSSTKGSKKKQLLGIKRWVICPKAAACCTRERCRIEASKQPNRIWCPNVDPKNVKAKTEIPSVLDEDIEMERSFAKRAERRHDDDD